MTSALKFISPSAALRASSIVPASRVILAHAQNSARAHLQREIEQDGWPVLSCRSINELAALIHEPGVFAVCVSSDLHPELHRLINALRSQAPNIFWISLSPNGFKDSLSQRLMQAGIDLSLPETAHPSILRTRLRQIQTKAKLIAPKRPVAELTIPRVPRSPLLDLSKIPQTHKEQIEVLLSDLSIRELAETRSQITLFPALQLDQQLDVLRDPLGNLHEWWRAYQFQGYEHLTSRIWSTFDRATELSETLSGIHYLSFGWPSVTPGPLVASTLGPSPSKVDIELMSSSAVETRVTAAEAIESRRSALYRPQQMVMVPIMGKAAPNLGFLQVVLRENFRPEEGAPLVASLERLAQQLRPHLQTAEFFARLYKRA